MSQKRHATNTPGISYRLHSTRKHGVNFDRYYSMRFSINNQRQEEGVGWASEGWTEKKVAALLAELKSNVIQGSGPRSLREKRAGENDRRDQEEIKLLLNTELRFENIFNAYCKVNTHKVSLKDEKSYFNSWLKMSIGHKSLALITLKDLNNIKAAMQKAGRTPRTINYIKAIVRQVYNHAIDHKIYSGDIPTTRFFLRQNVDNKRQRTLTIEEAIALLQELKNRSNTLYRISLLSLYTGMRFGEIAGLQWQHINLDHATLFIADPKNKESRYASLNEDSMGMFNELIMGRPSDWVFPNRKGQKLGQISFSFSRAVDALELNKGITDDRLKVVFHTLRHTHATWLCEYANANIMVIARALGHKTLAMTQRYIKVNDTQLRDAVNNIKPHSPDKINNEK